MLCSCGACGIRHLDPTEYVQNVDLSNLDILRYSKEQEETFVSKSQRVTIVVNDIGDTKEIDCRDMLSFYKANTEHDDHRYHLHPELVSEQENGKIVTDICKGCHSMILKGKIPPFSIANGIDFGRIRRLGLTMPNIQEKLIVSKIRKYFCVVKIQPNNGSTRNFTMNKINGHVIMFAHDAPGVVKEVFAAEHIENVLRILCLCSKGKRDELLRNMLATTVITGRSYVVHQLLTVFFAMNCQYGGPNPRLPDFPQFKEIFTQAVSKIVKNAEVTSKTSNLRFEDRSGDDVAHARTGPDFGAIVPGTVPGAHVSGSEQDLEDEYFVPLDSNGHDRDENGGLRYSLVTEMAALDGTNKEKILLDAAGKAFYPGGLQVRTEHATNEACTTAVVDSENAQENKKVSYVGGPEEFGSDDISISSQDEDPPVIIVPERSRAANVSIDTIRAAGIAVAPSVIGTQVADEALTKFLTSTYRDEDYWLRPICFDQQPQPQPQVQPQPQP